MTPDSFDPLKRYVNVRLQQGVPIVDADVNELDDVRQFELRAFLKWFVGDGVPEGNDGFRIAAVNPPADNDFLISAGVPAPPAGSTSLDTALHNVGRLVVDGRDVLITADLRYTAQPLHETQPGAAALAAKWGVPVITKLSTPTTNGTTTFVYIDIWERLVTAAEAPELVRPGLGVETTSRTKREWVVRTGAGIPAPGDAAFLPGHSYYKLGAVLRDSGIATVTQQTLSDTREGRLLLPPAQLLVDTLGVDGVLDTLDYRRGRNRPAISLRDAINAILSGQVPATPDVSVSSATGVDNLRRGGFVDTDGNLVVVWNGQRGPNGLSQVLAAKQQNIGQLNSFTTQTVTTTDSREPAAVGLPGGGIIVAYQNGPNGGSTTDVKFKQAATFAGLASATETDLASSSGAADEAPIVVVAGDQVVFFTHVATGSGAAWNLRRYKYGQPNGFVDASPTTFTSGNAASPTDLHAAASPDGMVWVAHGESGGNLLLRRLNPQTTPVGTDTTTTLSGLSSAGTSSTFNPFVLALSANNALVFYNDYVSAPAGLRVVAGSGGSWGTPVVIPGGADDIAASACLDDHGTVFLFTQRSTGQIVLRRGSTTGTDWSQAQPVAGTGVNIRPQALFSPAQGVCLFWASNRGANGLDVYAKRLISKI